MEGVDPNDESLIELPVDAGTKRRRGAQKEAAPSSRARSILLAVAVAVIGLIAVNIVLADDEDVPAEAASDDEGLTEFPAALEARPDAILTGLEDGQSVRYELDSLPFSVGTVTVVCLSDPDTEPESLLDICDSGTAQRRTTSPGGVLEVDLTVYRQIAVGGFRRIDCAERACELRTYADQAPGVVVGRAMLEWTSTPAQRLGPQITVEAESPLTDGDPFVVVGSGFPADTSITIQPCRVEVGADPFACADVLDEATVMTGADGTFRHDDLADWQIGTGPEAITCGELDIGRCAVTVTLAGVERQPAAVPLDILSDRRLSTFPELPDTLEVSPADDLLDRDRITITIDEPFAETEFEPFICAAADEPVDCTWLDLANAVDDGVYEIPRAFMTWRATRHDCLVDGPCVISVFSFRDPSQRLEVPISFEPDTALQPAVPIVVTPTTELQDSSVLTVEFEDLVSVPLVSMCASGTTRTCQALTTDSPTGRNLITRVRTALVTPVGPHNCLTDGPCELVVWDAANLTRFETIPLEFAPTDQRPLSGVVRPRDGIRHGDTVQLAVNDAVDDVTVDVCAVDGGCVTILTVPLRERGLFEFTAVQRFTVFRPEDRTVHVVDCAIDDCEVQLSDGWTTGRVPLGFADDPPEPAALAVTADPLPLDEPFTVRGRGFTPTAQPSEIRLQLCPPATDLDSSCVLLGRVSSRLLSDDGTFETTVTIPSSAFTTGFQNTMDRCGRECELVARPLYGEVTRLAVIRAIN